MTTATEIEYWRRYRDEVAKIMIRVSKVIVSLWPSFIAYKKNFGVVHILSRHKNKYNKLFLGIDNFCSYKKIRLMSSIECEIKFIGNKGNV